MIDDFPIEIARRQIRVNLKMFPLGSYDVIIGMD